MSSGEIDALHGPFVFELAVYGRRSWRVEMSGVGEAMRSHAAFTIGWSATVSDGYQHAFEETKGAKLQCAWQFGGALQRASEGVDSRKGDRPSDREGAGCRSCPPQRTGLR